MCFEHDRAEIEQAKIFGLYIGPMHTYLMSDQRQNAPSKSTDNVLIAQVRAKRVSALQEIYRRYARLVHVSALRILKSKEEAEDITQEIFLILWYRCHYDQSRGSFKNFLVMKTRSHSIDRLRSHQARQRVAQRLYATDGPQSSQNPIELFERKQSAQKIRKALLTLPFKEREVLKSAYYEGLSQIEIAHQLNIPLGTVKSCSRQGLSKLRCALFEQL